MGVPEPALWTPFHGDSVRTSDLLPSSGGGVPRGPGSQAVRITRNVSQDALSQEVHPVSWVSKHQPTPVSAPSVLLNSKVACSLLSV